MTGAYWLSVLERAVKTAAQAFLALVTTNVAGVTDLAAGQTFSVIGLAVLVSVATSLLSISLAPGDGPAAFGPEKVDG